VCQDKPEKILECDSNADGEGSKKALHEMIDIEDDRMMRGWGRMKYWHREQHSARYAGLTDRAIEICVGRLYKQEKQDFSGICETTVGHECKL
jgi:hypothetical protein